LASTVPKRARGNAARKITYWVMLLIVKENSKLVDGLHYWALYPATADKKAERRAFFPNHAGLTVVVYADEKI